MFDPTLTEYAIISEVTPGTTPTATPAFKKIDYVSGTQIDYVHDSLESDTVRPDRSLATIRKLRFRDEGSIKVNMKRDNGLEILLLSALSSSGFTGGVAKAGTTDTFFTVEKKMVDGATLNFRRFTGCTCTGVTLSSDATGDVTGTFDILGMGQTTGTAPMANSTYTASQSKTEMTGLDVSITVNGVTAPQFRKFDLKIEHNRETQEAFGSANVIGIGTSGNRTVTFSGEFYRQQGFALDALITPDVPVQVVVTLTPPGAASGYSITIPAFMSMLPKDSADGSKMLSTIDGKGIGDATSGTSVFITQLA